MIDLRFNSEDAAQVLVGSFSLAVPIAFTEEAWRLGESLPWPNLALVFALSLSFLGLFAYQSVFDGEISDRIAHFCLRLILGYGLALSVVAIVLLSLNRFPLFDEPLVTLRRLVVVGMPASMGAIVVDSLDKEKWP